MAREISPAPMYTTSLILGLMFLCSKSPIEEPIITAIQLTIVAIMAAIVAIQFDCVNRYVIITVRMLVKSVHSAYMKNQRHQDCHHSPHSGFSPLPFDCLIPSAGLSRRMGSWKPLVEYRGRPLIMSAVEHALSACARVLVVTGHRGGELEQLLRQSYRGSERVHWVRNRYFERGMFSSIQAGVSQIHSNWFFVALGDMPEIPPDLYAYLAGHTTAAERGLYDIIRPVYQGRPAHPVLLRSTVAQSIQGLPADGTMQKVFEFHRQKTGRGVLEIETDEPGSLYDIDTNTDLTARDVPAVSDISEI